MKISYHNKLSLEKEGNITKIGEDCVEWFLSEMLETKAYMRNYCKSDKELNPDTIVDCDYVKKLLIV